MRFYKVLKSREGKPFNIEEIKPKIEKICKENGILLFYLFGSYAKNQAHKLSDIDLAFLSCEKMDLSQKFQLMDKLIEIFEDEGIDLVDLRRIPLTLIHRILKEGICLYAEDLKTKIEWETKWETLYMDKENLRKEYFQKLIKRIESGSFGDR